MRPDAWVYAHRRFATGTVAEAWRAGGRFRPAGSRAEGERIRLPFGTGGLHTAQAPGMRDAMPEPPGASAALMGEDLRVLLIEPAERRSRLRADHATPPP